MNWPLALRSTVNELERDNDRLRIENSTHRKVRAALEGSNNALREVHAAYHAEIKELKAKLYG